jgi:glycerol-3-phosphate acyltransferase PlsY
MSFKVAVFVGVFITANWNKAVTVLSARFVTGQYNRYQSVTSMKQELKWTSLQRRQEQ